MSMLNPLNQLNSLSSTMGVARRSSVIPQNHTYRTLLSQSSYVTYNSQRVNDLGFSILQRQAVAPGRRNLSFFSPKNQSSTDIPKTVTPSVSNPLKKLMNQVFDWWNHATVEERVQTEAENAFTNKGLVHKADKDLLNNQESPIEFSAKIEPKSAEEDFSAKKLQLNSFYEKINPILKDDPHLSTLDNRQLQIQQLRHIMWENGWVREQSHAVLKEMLRLLHERGGHEEVHWLYRHADPATFKDVEYKELIMRSGLEAGRRHNNIIIIEHTLEIISELRKNDPNNSEYLYVMARCHHHHIDWLSPTESDRQENKEKINELRLKTLDLYQQAYLKDHDPVYGIFLMITHFKMGQVDEAMKLARELDDHYQRMGGTEIVDIKAVLGGLVGQIIVAGAEGSFPQSKRSHLLEIVENNHSLSDVELAILVLTDFESFLESLEPEESVASKHCISVLSHLIDRLRHRYYFVIVDTGHFINNVPVPLSDPTRYFERIEEMANRCLINPSQMNIDALTNCTLHIDFVLRNCSQSISNLEKACLFIIELLEDYQNLPEHRQGPVGKILRCADMLHRELLNQTIAAPDRGEDPKPYFLMAEYVLRAALKCHRFDKLGVNEKVRINQSSLPPMQYRESRSDNPMYIQWTDSNEIRNNMIYYFSRKIHDTNIQEDSLLYQVHPNRMNNIKNTFFCINNHPDYRQQVSQILSEQFNQDIVILVRQEEVKWQRINQDGFMVSSDVVKGKAIVMKIGDLGELSIGHEDLLKGNYHHGLSISVKLYHSADALPLHSDVMKKFHVLLSIIGHAQALKPSTQLDIDSAVLQSLIEKEYPGIWNHLMQTIPLFAGNSFEFCKKEIFRYLEENEGRPVIPFVMTRVPKGAAEKFSQFLDSERFGGQRCRVVELMGENAFVSSITYEKSKLLGLKGFYSGMSSESARQVLKTGWYSTYRKSVQGCVASSNCPADLTTGGNENVFTRVVTDQFIQCIDDKKLMPKNIPFFNDCHLIFHPAMISITKRASLYNSYGVVKTKPGTVPDIPDAEKAIKTQSGIIEVLTSYNENPADYKENEFMTNQSIPPFFILGLLVKNRQYHVINSLIMNVGGFVVDEDLEIAKQLMVKITPEAPMLSDVDLEQLKAICKRNGILNDNDVFVHKDFMDMHRRNASNKFDDLKIDVRKDFIDQLVKEGVIDSKGYFCNQMHVNDLVRYRFEDGGDFEPSFKYSDKNKVNNYILRELKLKRED